jgi:hypothetical protein
LFIKFHIDIDFPTAFKEQPEWLFSDLARESGSFSPVRLVGGLVSLSMANGMSLQVHGHC